MSDPEPTDADRYPVLSDHGVEMLKFLKEHPAAPLYRNQSGHRLTADDVEHVRTFEREVASAEVRWSTSAPGWLGDWVERCYRDVPYYRALGSAPTSFELVPSVDRGSLARDIAGFVPDHVDLSRLINFQTTGSTGHPLVLPSHPRVAASYLAFHKRAFARFGVQLDHHRGQVGVVLLGYQKKCFTYVSVTPTQDESGLAKINLHPDDWRDPADRVRYLEALAPEVIAGDPLSFEALLTLDAGLRPKALLSTSMTLTAGLCEELAERFCCPVLDVYSLNEAGPIAVYDPLVDGHVLLQHCMLVEILDAEDRPVAPGERGEITLTGGFNFCLPLLRYRTGDFAALGRVGNEPVLEGFEGRRPVRFRTTAGTWLNNIDVTHALKPFALRQYSLHQDANASLRFLGSGTVSAADLASALCALFGADQSLTLELNVDFRERFPGKVQQYSSELSPEAGAWS